MSGCAGGLSGGLWAAFDAELRSGADFVLEVLNFEPRLRAADAAITGEGRFDAQSLKGKIAGRIASACASSGRDLHVVAGQNQLPTGAVGAMAVRSIRAATTLTELRMAGQRIAQEAAEAEQPLS
jgi:glycerate kinase